jgi:hypothetical protein
MPKFLPILTTPDGTTLYALDTSCGEVVSYWPKGRANRGAEDLLEEPRYLKRQRSYRLYDHRGEYVNTTRRKMLETTLDVFWSGRF